MNRRIDHLGMTGAALIDIGKTSEASVEKSLRMSGRWRRGLQLGISVALGICGAITAFENRAFAQITPDATLGTESSIVTPNANVRGLPAELIQGGATRGANLFHSFDQFNVGNGQRVYFANPAGIENILSRVTGNNLSNILGTLGVDGGASLFLLNPNGIIFGQNAKLDIAGSFVASTANSLVFENGSKFSATNPEAPPLLKISITPGLQYGTTQPGATIRNSGNLAVGQNLTLSAGNLDLQGQLLAGRDLTLFAQDTVKVRDSVTNPFIASSDGKLLLQGNQKVDIFALNHPDSGLFSGGDMVLRSANTVGGDAHYWSGGSFRIEKLDGSLGNLFSPNDPIILTNGNVSLGDYTGASLHILAGGSVTLGNVTITGTDSQANTINPGNAIPFNGTDKLGSLANFTLSDGTTLTIDGSTKPTLDIRAGIDWTTFPGGAPTVPIFGTVTPAPTFGGGATSADISVTGTIRVSQPDGVVLLTNQYRSNTLPGNISTQGIDARNNNFSNSVSSNGGSISIDSRGSINTGNLISSSLDRFRGLGGAIALIAGGNINTGSLSSDSPAGIGTAGRGGAINLTSTNGRITITGNIDSLAGGRNGARNGTGIGGRIDLKAANGITVTGDLNSYYAVRNDYGNGGAISLFTTNGNISTGNLNSYSLISLYPGGNGGTITLTASNGSIKTGDLNPQSSSQSPVTDSTVGTGGDVILKAGSSITTGKVNTTTFAVNSYGNISLTAGNEIDLKEGKGSTIALTAGSNISVPKLVSLPDQSNSGTITVTAGGNINAPLINSYSVGGNGGTIALTAGGNISASFIDSSSNNGNGGAIAIASRAGAFSVEDGTINSNASANGNGGNIRIDAASVSLVNTEVTTTAAGVGNAGTISIAADGSFFMDRSRLFTSVEPETTGAGGDIKIDAKSVSLTNFSFIDTTTSDRGNAGNVLIRAEDLVALDKSSIFSITTGQGNAGNVTVQARGNTRPPDVTLTNHSNISTAVGSRAEGNGGDTNINARSLLITGGAQIQALTRGEGNATNSRGSSGKIGITADSVTISGISSDGFLSGLFTSTDAANSGQGGNINITTPGTLLVADGAVLSAQTSSTFAGGNILVRANRLELNNGGQLLTSTSSSGLAGDISVEAAESVTISGVGPNSNNRVSPGNLIPTCAVAGIACGTGANPNVNFSSRIPYVSISATGTGQTDTYSFEVTTAGTRAFFDIDNGLKYEGSRPNETPQSVDTLISLFDSRGNQLATNNDALVTLGKGGSTPTRNSTLNGTTFTLSDISKDSYLRYMFTEPGRYSLKVSEASRGSIGIGKIGVTGVHKGGTYTLQASLENPNVAGSVIDANPASGLFARTQGAGAAGGITIKTPQFTLQDGAQISASTSGAGKGGSVTLRAPQSITLSGNSTLSATADVSSTGIAGDVLLSTPQLTVTNGARVSASTNSLNASATGGNLTIQAEQLNLTGKSTIDAGTTGAAPGGNLTIKPFINESTLNFNLQDGSSVSASTSGSGRGGTLTVTAPESISISGNGTLAATADASSTGIAGDVLLSTPQLTITNGARVSASTNSLNASATGGNLTIQAEQLNLTGKSTIDAGTTGAAPGGNLLIQPLGESPTLSVNFQGGSVASASSSGSGKGGTLTVTAPESITLSGNGSFISAETSGSGAGGDLNLNAGLLTVRDGAKVTVSSTGTGDAGNLNVNANFVLLDNGQLIAETASGEGGNINLNVEDLLLMRHNSLISAQAGNNGNGGNININNSGFIVAVPREDSDIVADADRGNGGNINITTQGIFGLKFRPQRTPESDITASSKFGLSGTVTINQLNVDPSRGLGELPANLVDASRQIDRRCKSGSTQRNSFTITGRGGIPQGPNDVLQGESVITPNWVTPDSKTENNTPPTSTTPRSSAPRQLVEAQGWMINDKGEVVLTASAPKVTPQGEWLSPPECSPSQSSTMP